MNRSHNPEGYRNPNDIYDNSTFTDIEKEVDRERLGQQIRFHFDTTVLDKESEVFLERWKTDIQMCLEKWKEEIRALIEEDQRISKRIKEYLEIKGMDLPTFDVYRKKEAELILKDFGFHKENIANRDFLVVFNLPKPLSQYWWKGGVDSWGSESKDVRKMVIEWGRIYRRIIYVIWDAVDYGESTMERINPCGVHDPKRFYYLWEMGADPTHRYDTQDEYLSDTQDEYPSDTTEQHPDW